GQPSVTERVWMLAPGSRIGPATDEERAALRNGSTLASKYDQPLDRESAYEVLMARTEGAMTEDAPATKTEQKKPAQEEDGGLLGEVSDFLFGSTGPRGGKHEGLVQSTLKSVVRREAGKLLRGVLGSLVGRKR